MDINKKTTGLLLGIGLLIGGLAAAGYAVNAQKNSAQPAASIQSEKDDSEMEAPAVLKAGNISAEQAKQAALAGRTGVTAGQITLEDDQDGQSYEVKLSDGSEVDVDATTGKIIDDAAEDGGQDDASGQDDQNEQED